MKVAFSDTERELLKCIGQTADALGIEAYAIGGYVRDHFLKRPSKDVDIMCVGSGIALANAVAQTYKPTPPKVVVFKRFGTAMMRLQDWEVEFVGARRESYSKDSRKPVVEKGSLQDDLNRRDFSINTLALRLNATSFGELIDRFEGLADLRAGIIRTPLDPDITFSDDPLRMMRAIRFATQLEFKIDADTFASIYKNRERLSIISQERITSELQKIIASPVPSVGFKLLFDSGLLAIFFPEMQRLHGVQRVNGRAHKDNFYHTLQVLDNLSIHTDNIWLRWAAILHDIAKPATQRFEQDHGWTFHGHEVVGARWVPKIFRRLKLPMDQPMKYVQKLVRLHLRPISLTKEGVTDSGVRRLLFDAEDDIDDLMMLCEADITSKNEFKVKRYKENYERLRQLLIEVEEKDRLRNWQPPISGDLIMRTFGIAPSRQVGIIKNAIREAILDGDLANDFDAAYAYMLEIGKEQGLTAIEK